MPIPMPTATFVDPFFCFHSRAELAENVEEDDDADEGEAGDEDRRGTDLQAGAVVRVELQNVVAGSGGPAAAVGRPRPGLSLRRAPLSRLTGDRCVRVVCACAVVGRNEKK